MPDQTSNFEVNRELYDHADLHTPKYTAQPGLNEEVVRKISTDKKEPEWMLKKRLAGLEAFKKTALPTWGPDLSKLEIDNIIYYIDPNAKESKSWDDVPPEIRKTFDRLGIPEAEKSVLAGVGAQYDAGVIYHKLKEDLEQKGVIFENMDVAVQKYPEMVKKYFMSSCIPVNTHKFTMLHAAVWSGGTFIYVPKNVKVDLPLQAYFRMNAERGGQFEHTLIIVDEGAELHYIEGCSSPRYQQDSLHAGCVEIHVLQNAKMKYTSIENWSKNVYNLNTKRAIVHRDANMVWVNGNMGSVVTMLYPMSVLIGEGASSESVGIVFAGPGQNQDTGAKVLHAAPNTTSTIDSRSISRGGGIATYRGLVHITANAKNCRAFMKCNGLILDPISKADAIPVLKIENSEVEAAHEATIGKIGDEEIFYLMSRGLNKNEAIQMIVAGYIEPVTKALPLEYAVELNKLIEMEIEGH
jgi:Fe-S cluster assembly protein SufB